MTVSASDVPATEPTDAPIVVNVAWPMQTGRALGHVAGFGVPSGSFFRPLPKNARPRGHYGLRYR